MAIKKPVKKQVVKKIDKKPVAKAKPEIKIEDPEGKVSICLARKDIALLKTLVGKDSKSLANYLTYMLNVTAPAATVIEITRK